jgi:hypothetical protein
MIFQKIRGGEKWARSSNPACFQRHRRQSTGDPTASWRASTRDRCVKQIAYEFFYHCAWISLNPCSRPLYLLHKTSMRGRCVKQIAYEFFYHCAWISLNPCSRPLYLLHKKNISTLEKWTMDFQWPRCQNSVHIVDSRPSAHGCAQYALVPTNYACMLAIS